MKIAKLSLVIAVFLASVAAVGQEKKTPWKVSGDLEEACSCDAACPCWFDCKPTKMTCGGGQVIFIEKGSYGDVPLDGLAIAMMGQSPEGKTMMESIGNWNFMNSTWTRRRPRPSERRSRRSSSDLAPRGRRGEDQDPVRPDHPEDQRRRARRDARPVRELLRPPDPRRDGHRLSEAGQPSGRRPDPQEYSQGRTSKQTLDRRRAEVELVQLQLHVHDVQRVERRLRQVRHDDDAGDGEGEGREDQELTPATAGRNPRRGGA